MCVHHNISDISLGSIVLIAQQIFWLRVQEMSNSNESKVPWFVIIADSHTLNSTE